MRAADCVASLKRWGKRDGMGQALLEATKAFDVVDDRTFTLTPQEPYGLVLPWLAKLSSDVPFVLPERVANTDAFTPFKPFKETGGSGPFKFVAEEWVPGSKVVYVRNPDVSVGATPVQGRGSGQANGSVHETGADP